MVEVCKKYLTQNRLPLRGPQTHHLLRGRLKFIRSRQEEYDLIIVDSTDFRPGEGLFTREFTATASRP